MSDSILVEAARWHAAQDNADMDWDGFTLWLEGDPRHRAAFDALALLDDDVMSQRIQIDALLRPAKVTAQHGPRWRNLGLAGVGVIAASLALVVAPPYLSPRSGPSTSFTTSRAETQQIALPDGSRITLAPTSRLTVGGTNQTQLALVGTAYFDVPHRPDRDLTVSAGGLVVRDIGTRFAIDSTADGARVAVAEGRISIASAALQAPVSISAGQNFTLSRAAGIAQRGSQRIDTVGSWRRGQLIYESTPLPLVASDLARYAGTTITVDPAIATRRFSGILTIGDGTGLVGNLATLMALKARAAPSGIRLEPAGKP